MGKVSRKRYLLKKGVMTLSVACASLILMGTTAVEAKGPLTTEIKIEAVKKTSLTEERINTVLKEAYEKFKDNHPFVNAGAIQSTSWVDAKDSKERWAKIKGNMDDFAGRELPFNEEVYQSEVNDNKRNQVISKILDAYGRMGSDPLEATTVYTKQCSVNISAHDFGVMGATFANDGINPLTKKRVIDEEYIPHILAVMATAGLYDNAGDWLYLTGTPAKSGVGGGILAIVPGKMGIGVVSPPLDKFGNSVRGQQAAAYIIDQLGINPLAQ